MRVDNYVMNRLLPIILAARNYDEDSGWMQFLVFIIIAVIYAISGFIKKSRKSETELEEDEHLEGVLGYPSRRQYKETATTVEKPVFSQQSKPAGRKVFAEPPQARVGQKRRSGQGGQAKTLETPYVTNLSSPAAVVVQPGISESLETQEKQVPATKKAKVKKQLEDTKALADLNSPKDLRKAIVTYEIIGKPISLRE